MTDDHDYLLSYSFPEAETQTKMAPLTSAYILGTPAPYTVQVDPEKGRGLFAVTDGQQGAGEGQPAIKAGQLILEERPCVTGPKQTSPLVCVECSRTLEEEQGEFWLLF